MDPLSNRSHASTRSNRETNDNSVSYNLNHSSVPVPQVMASNQLMTQPTNRSLQPSTQQAPNSRSAAADLHRLHTLQGSQLLANATAETITPNYTRYSNLGPHYYSQAPSKTWVKMSDQEGVRHWDQLVHLISATLATTAKADIEVVLDNYLCGSLMPSEAVLQQLNQLFCGSPNRQVTLTLQQDHTTPSIRIPLNNSHPHVTQAHLSQAHWHTTKGQALIEQVERRYPTYSALVRAAEQAHNIDPDADQGRWLQHMIDRLEDSDANLTVPSNQRSKIFDYFHQANQELQACVKEAALQNPQLVDGLTPEALHQHPLQQLFEQHPPNNSGSNCWYSIGAGQMVSLLEFVRRQIDIGTLPLDFTLLADNRSFEGVDEINQTGMRRSILNQLPINPAGHKPIYVFNHLQRPDALLKHRPEVILLNVKVSSLNEVITSTFVKELLQKNEYCPTLVMPAKSYNNEGQIPYLDLYQTVSDLYPELAEKLTVMGGFFAAPSILSGNRVDITVASKTAAPLAILARGMSPSSVDSDHQANCDWLNLKLIPNQPTAIALMAGGANKNFLTYRSAFNLMSELFKQKSLNEQTVSTLSEKLYQEKERNIDIGEETTARLVKACHLTDSSGSAITTVHIASPHGLQEDFRNCLPPKVEGLIAITERLKAISSDVSMGRHSDDLINAYVELIESIRADEKKELGTRNSRDGLIDATIHHLFQHPDHYRSLHSAINSDHSNHSSHYAPFYQALYPKVWSGKYGQEGRNGIGHLLKFADQHSLTLPQAVYEAWNLYRPDLPRTIEGSKRLALTQSLEGRDSLAQLKAKTDSMLSDDGELLHTAPSHFLPITGRLEQLATGEIKDRLQLLESTLSFSCRPETAFSQKSQNSQNSQTSPPQPLPRELCLVLQKFSVATDHNAALNNLRSANQLAFDLLT